MGLRFVKTCRRLALLTLSAALVAGFAGCSKSTPAIKQGGGPSGVKKSSAIAVQITYPETETLERRTEFAGKLAAAQSVKVYPEVGGTVAKTYFNAGDTVKKGDLLFELNDADAQTALKKAELAYQKTLADIASAESGSANALTELQYQNAITAAQNSYERARDSLEVATGDDFDLVNFKRYRKNLKNAEDAYDDDQSAENWDAYNKAMKDYTDMLDDYASYSNYKDQITKFETAYDDYLAALDKYDIYKSMTTGENAASRDITRSQAELTYQDAQKAVSDHKVYAPVSGVIAAKSVSAYNVISAQTSSYVISQEGLPTVSFNLSEGGASAMTLGAPVVVTYNGKEYNAEVIELSPEADSSTGLYPAKAQFIENIGDLTRSGAVVKVMAVTAQEKNTLTVSIDNIYYEGNQPYLYIYDDGIAKRNDVTIGMMTVDKVSVTSGITANDAIITTWHPSLKDGAKVSNKQLDDDSASSEAAPQDGVHPNEAPVKKEG
ncbi:MAG: efflux transporter, family, subunit [Oscillospiraceae bacterium]|jgi:RND family efflux transporter MFP subunit|nr:efflux transporter, family, subunit [Oscillospiraceae bacterium]